MSISDFVDVPRSATTGRDRDPAMEIADLRQQGAHRLNPARFHFIEALARRTLEHDGEVQGLLSARLIAAVAAYQDDLEQAKSDAQTAIAQLLERDPRAGEVLQQMLQAGDFKGIQRHVAGLKGSSPSASLAELTRALTQYASASTESGAEDDPGFPPELKSVRYFRASWSRLSADRRVRQALERGPENAGPLNAHQLVLRSLAMMREVAPDYLGHFMEYADALLWLDHADYVTRPMERKAASSDGKARQKGTRSKSSGRNLRS